MGRIHVKLPGSVTASSNQIKKMRTNLLVLKFFVQNASVEISNPAILDLLIDGHSGHQRPLYASHYMLVNC